MRREMDLSSKAKVNSSAQGADGAGDLAAEQPVSGRVNTFASLSYANFRYLWFGQISNSLSLWIEQVARPLLVLDLTGSAVQLGLVIAVRTLPQLGLGLVAGVFADWYNRRTIILVSKIGAMVANFILAILILAGVLELWHIYATALLRGIFAAFDNPARQALIPTMVKPEHLTNAVALNSGSMNMMRIVGASLAGLLLVVFGVGGTFLTVALISVLAVFFTFMLRVPSQPKVKRTVAGVGRSFVEGLQYVWRLPDIRGIIFASLFYFTLGMAYLQVFAPLFAKQVLGIGDAGFGFMISAAGAGSLVGALIMGTFSPSHHRGKLLLGFMALVGTFLMLFSGASYLPWVYPTFVAIAIVGTFSSGFVTIMNTALLEKTPADMRGRVMGVLSLDRSMISLGSTVAGFTSAAFGPQLAQMGFGIAVLLAAVSLAILQPNLRNLD